MKKRTLSKLKSFFGSKSKVKRLEESDQFDQSPSPASSGVATPINTSLRPCQRTPPQGRVGPSPSPPVPTSPVVPVPPEPTGHVQLTPCPVCGRTFVPQSLSKHVKICEKMMTKKRKTFDSSRQRREGTDLEQFLPKNFGLPENSPFLEKSPPPSAKIAAAPVKKPTVRSAIKKPAADLQRCPHCSRAFGQRAYERHVEWCQEKAKILPAAPLQTPAHISDAKQRLNARTQYKAPLARGRRSSQSRDKSSNSRSQSVESSRGVSPPARDFDYRKGRCRASESVSSNDHEDSPHVPIIKNTRQSISNLSESNAKARQARLARDLSSSRKSKPSSGDQNHSTDRSKTTPRTIINAKRKNIENIKKIENKYKDREKQNQDLNKLEEKFKYIKSNIPVVTKMVPSKVTSSEKSKNRNSSKANVKEVPVESVDSKVPSKSHKKSLPKQNSKNRNIKESTMSLDSLDEQRTAVEVNPAHEDTDDKLSCVCVPCVINESVIVKSSSKNINKKLPTVTHKIKKDQFVEKEMDDSFQDENSKTVVSNIIKVEPTLVYNNIIEKEVPDAIEQFNKVKEIVTLKESDCSYEEYSDSLDKKYDRNGSGDTYTKHSENLEDLEEFMNLTDNLLQNQERELEENLLADFHTPNTTSMETSSVVETTSDRIAASKTFENLKHDLQQLLLHEKNNAKQDKKSNLISVNIKEICKQEEIAETKSEESADNKSNMEHIQLYEFKSKKEENTNSTHDLKLPSINTNKQRKSKNCINLKRSKQKKNRYTIYEKECISDEESDLKSVSAEVPPLKLPRIDTKRLDDNYDPFLSAARQMKELMSSETNIHKRLYSSTKDINRTLPILRTSKDKISSRPDYTKTMKESMNRSYQRAPSLQRMKSFDSSNHNTISSFGQRCNSFRVNRNDNKSSHKLNTTFTKSSKDNISIPDKNNFNRNNIMNRSFSGYSASCHSTPKPRDKIPKISTSMYHSFQRNTSKQPKTNKVQKNEIKNEIKSNFVNLDCILADDNVSIADSNYIDPRLINETDNLPINVNTILNNPDIISSMESLLTTENLPAKFESFNGNNINGHINKILDNDMKNKLDVETNNNLNLANKKRSKIFDELSNQYDKIMSSLEVSATSKSSLRDDESICEDFDIEEFMTNFDDVVTKQKTDDKRISSSTTRIIKQSELFLDNKDANSNSISNLNKLEKNNSNGSIHYIKSDCLNFSTNNIAETLFPSSIKRSTSLLDSMQKKNVQRVDSSKMRHKVDQLEQDIMQSLKEFDKFYESETQEKNGMHYNGHVMNGNATTKRPRVKSEKTNKMNGDSSHTLNGKSSYDSAYSSLNRISPSKLSISNSKDSNGVESLERIPSRSDTSGHHDMRSVSSDEFLAMERSIEIEPTSNHEDAKMYEKHGDSNRCTDNRSHSRASRPRSPTWPSQPDLHSSSSESSVFKPRKDSLPSPAPRLSRFCHECGQKFPVDTAKFCIECGVKRLLV